MFYLSAFCPFWLIWTKCPLAVTKRPTDTLTSVVWGSDGHRFYSSSWSHHCCLHFGPPATERLYLSDFYLREPEVCGCCGCCARHRMSQTERYGLLQGHFPHRRLLGLKVTSVLSGGCGVREKETSPGNRCFLDQGFFFKWARVRLWSCSVKDSGVSGLQNVAEADTWNLTALSYPNLLHFNRYGNSRKCLCWHEAFIFTDCSL